jgi:hypothetical protein
MFDFGDRQNQRALGREWALTQGCSIHGHLLTQENNSRKTQQVFQ